jgi:hypothetical protein
MTLPFVRGLTVCADASFGGESLGLLVVAKNAKIPTTNTIANKKKNFSIFIGEFLQHLSLVCERSSVTI